MKKDIKALNGLKIPFAIMIILTHYQGNLCWNKSPVSWLAFFFNYGSLGVEFFFILSGFLIAYNYKDRIYNMTLRDFWGGRIRRLLPYYFYGIILDMIIFIVDQFVLKTNIFQYSTLKLNLFNVIISFIMPLRSGINTNVFNGVLWFMCDLSIAYILYYIISKVSKKYSEFYVVSITLIAIISLDGMHQQINYFIFSEHIFRTFSCFFVGLILFEFYNILINKNLIKTGYVLLFSILSLAILTIIFNAEQVLGEDRLHIRMSFIIFIIPAIILAAISVPWLNKILSIKWIQLAAGYTTALYVSHADIIHLFHILQVYFKWNVNYLNSKIFWFIITLCLFFAVISEYFIDKTFKKAKK